MFAKNENSANGTYWIPLINPGKQHKLCLFLCGGEKKEGEVNFT